MHHLYHKPGKSAYIDFNSIQKVILAMICAVFCETELNYFPKQIGCVVVNAENEGKILIHREEKQDKFEFPAIINLPNSSCLFNDAYIWVCVSVWTSHSEGEKLEDTLNFVHSESSFSRRLVLLFCTN